MMVCDPDLHLATWRWNLFESMNLFLLSYRHFEQGDFWILFFFFSIWSVFICFVVTLSGFLTLHISPSRKMFIKSIKGWEESKRKVKGRTNCRRASYKCFSGCVWGGGVTVLQMFFRADEVGDVRRAVCESPPPLPPLIFSHIFTPAPLPQMTRGPLQLVNRVTLCSSFFLSFPSFYSHLVSPSSLLPLQCRGQFMVSCRASSSSLSAETCSFSSSCCPPLITWGVCVLGWGGGEGDQKKAKAKDFRCLSSSSVDSEGR